MTGISHLIAAVAFFLILFGPTRWWSTVVLVGGAGIVIVQVLEKYLG